MQYVRAFILLLLALALVLGSTSAAEVTISDLERTADANRSMQESAQKLLSFHRSYYSYRTGKAPSNERMIEILNRLVEVRTELGDEGSQSYERNYSDPRLRSLSQEEAALRSEAQDILEWRGREAKRAAKMQQEFTDVAARFKYELERFRNVNLLDEVKQLVTAAEKVASNPELAPPIDALGKVAAPKKVMQKRRLHVIKLADGKEIIAKQVIEAGDELTCMDLKGKTVTVAKKEVVQRTEEEKEFEAVATETPIKEEKKDTSADATALRNIIQNLDRQIDQLQDRLNAVPHGDANREQRTNLQQQIKKLQQDRESRREQLSKIQGFGLQPFGDKQ